VDQATALRVLIALSRGDSVERTTVIEAGREAAESLQRGGTRYLIHPDDPSSEPWDLERLTDEQAATLAEMLSTASAGADLEAIDQDAGLGTSS
jgi:hypothetical protein